MSEANHVENSKATGAPGTIELGGRVLVVSKLTPDEYILIDHEWRRQCLKLTQRPLLAIAEDVAKMPPALAKMAIEEAVRQQAGTADGQAEPTEEMVFSRIYEPEGCAFHLWVRLQRAHPDVSLEWVQTQIPDKKTALHILAELAKVEGLSEKKESDTSLNSGATISATS